MCTPNNDCEDICHQLHRESDKCYRASPLYCTFAEKFAYNFRDYRAFPVAQLVKNPPTMRETWVGKIRWRRDRLPTPVFWPREFHGLYTIHGVTKSQTRLSDFHFHFLEIQSPQNLSVKLWCLPGFSLCLPSWRALVLDESS